MNRKPITAAERAFAIRVTATAARRAAAKGKPMDAMNEAWRLLVDATRKPRRQLVTRLRPAVDSLDRAVREALQ